MSAHVDPVVSSEAAEVPLTATDVPVTPPTKPADVQKSGLPDPYLLCELCNAIVYDEVAHRQLEHSDVDILLHSTNPAQSKDPASTARADGDLGAFVYTKVQVADQGPEVFAAIQNALKQFRRLLNTRLPSSPQVYIFGSCVSMGIWDGMGDADFSVLPTELLEMQASEAEKMLRVSGQDGEESTGNAGERSDDEGEAPGAGETAVQEDEQEDGATECPPSVDSPPPPTTTGGHSGKVQKRVETDVILGVARKLRDAGFKFEELEVIPRARVPLVKRRCEAKRPYEPRHLSGNYRINVHFSNARQSEQFRLGDFGLKEVPAGQRKGDPLTRAFELEDGAAALCFFSRRESPGIAKIWARQHRLPEIFALDFDISCRAMGIRNSWFLREYLAQDPVFRVGNLFVKQWSKQRGVNHSRQGFLTSYAMSCLWVYYLLRVSEASFVDPSRYSFKPTPEQEDISYMPLWPFEVTSAEHAAQCERLGKLVRGFFYFYAHEFDYETEVVTLRRDVSNASQRMTREERHWVVSNSEELLLRDRIYTNFCIEDVYEDLNLGRHLSPLKASWVRRQFESAAACCDSTDLAGLFVNPFEEAEETLHTRLFRCLVDRGPCTVKTLHDYLRQGCQSDDGPYHLAVYELRHRLSDLWFDEAIQQSDDAAGRYHSRRMDNFTPPANPIKQGLWAAICRSDVEADVLERRKLTRPPRRVDEESAVFPQRVVQLATPKGELVKAPLEDIVKRCQPVQSLLKSPKRRAFGVIVPAADPCRHLLRHLFFSLDSGIRLFDSFPAKSLFAEHLRLVAICLPNAQGVAEVPRKMPVGAVVKAKKKSNAGSRGKKNEEVDGTLAVVTTQVQARKLGLAQETLVRAILTSPDYVVPVAGRLQPTRLLEGYAGKVGAEEDVFRMNTSRF